MHNALVNVQGCNLVGTLGTYQYPAATELSLAIILIKLLKYMLYATTVVVILDPSKMGHIPLTLPEKSNTLENCMLSFKDVHLMHEMRPYGKCLNICEQFS